MMESKIAKNINGVIIKIKNEQYMLEVRDVKEIYIPGEKIVPVPLADKTIVGLIDIRGEIYSIISLRHKIYSNETNIHLNDQTRILLLEMNNLNVAILVDSVIGVKELPASIFETQDTIIETSMDYKFIKAIGVFNDQTYILLDLDTLISSMDSILSEKLDDTTKPRFQVKTKLKKRTGIPVERNTKSKKSLSLKPVSSKVVTPKFKESSPVSDINIILSEYQQDTLKEIGNIGSGNAITALSRLIKKKIDVSLTNVGIISFEQLAEQFGGPKERVCGIFCTIKKPSQSTILQVFDMKPLMKLVESLAGKNSKIDPNRVKNRKDLDEFAISTIQEMGNIMAGHYASAIADLIGIKIIIDPPEFAMSEAGLLGEFLSKELKSISKFVISIKTTIKIVDLKLNGMFFFIPNLKTLEIIFKKLDIEHDLITYTPRKASAKIDFDNLKLTEIQKDALKEIGNIGSGNAANALAKMLNKRVDIDIPAVEMVELDQYAKNISKRNEKLFVSWSSISGKTRATILSIFKLSDIIKITSIITGDKKNYNNIKSVNDFEDLFKSALSELGHILASHYATALGDLLNIRMMTGIPDMSISIGKQLFNILKDEIGLLEKLSLVITTNIIISDIKITGTFLYIPDLETLQELLGALASFYD